MSKKSKIVALALVSTLVVACDKKEQQQSRLQLRGDSSEAYTRTVYHSGVMPYYWFHPNGYYTNGGFHRSGYTSNSVHSSHNSPHSSIHSSHIARGGFGHSGGFHSSGG